MLRCKVSTLRIFFTLALLLGALCLCAPLMAQTAEQKSVGGKPGPAELAPVSQAAPELKFDVQVSTSSGSASNAPETAPLPINPVPTGAPVNSGVAAPEPSAPASADLSAPPLPPLTVEPTPAEELGDPAAPSPERQTLFEAMKTWQNENLKNYTYNIASLYDPFMPIKEVRGKPQQGGGDPEDEANLPPILKLELSQLKLVAITTVSGRSGSSLASFEDGAGSSYILRESDRIGRRKGRIIRIEPGQVLVEEAPRGSSTEPEITVIKLNVLDNSGLTLSSAGN